MTVLRGTAPVAGDLEQGGAHVAEFGDQLLQVWGGYNTGLFPTSTTNTAPPLAPHQPLRTEMVATWGDAVAPEPDTAAPVIMELAARPDSSRQLIVGSQSFDHVLEMDQAQADQYRS